MPRKSAASLQVIPLVPEASRLLPPANLSEPERIIFRGLVSAVPPDHFRASDMAQHPHRVTRGSLTGRTVLEAKVVQIPDIKADPEYILLAPISIPFRTTLGVPLM